jgi:ABC-type antimicrobial peptide transport system permease subunit
LALLLQANRLKGGGLKPGGGAKNLAGVAIKKHISGFSIFLSLGILCLVGLVAGIIPAMRDSRMNPVKALHYE